MGVDKNHYNPESMDLSAAIFSQISSKMLWQKAFASVGNKVAQVFLKLSIVMLKPSCSSFISS